MLVRKLIRLNRSVVLCLPGEVLDHLGLKVGEYVELQPYELSGKHLCAMMKLVSQKRGGKDGTEESRTS